jgi:hypothetical protein
MSRNYLGDLTSVLTGLPYNYIQTVAYGYQIILHKTVVPTLYLATVVMVCPSNYSISNWLELFVTCVCVWKARISIFLCSFHLIGIACSS